MCFTRSVEIRVEQDNESNDGDVDSRAQPDEACATSVGRLLFNDPVGHRRLAMAKGPILSKAKSLGVSVTVKI